MIKLLMSTSKNINKGTGAGGSKTTYNGLNFEDKTSIENSLDKLKYVKKEINNIIKMIILFILPKVVRMNLSYIYNLWL
jgi:hypothetical protein